MQKKSYRRKIQTVVDGDTLQLSRSLHGSRYVRLPNINAPERRQSGYLEAKNKLKKLEGKTVTIRPKGRSYGRIVGEVIYRRRRVR